MKTKIRILVEKCGWETCEIEFLPNPIGSPSLYRVTKITRMRNSETLDLRYADTVVNLDQKLADAHLGGYAKSQEIYEPEEPDQHPELAL